MDTPLLDLEESCLVMLTVPDTVQTEKGKIVIREYSEECGPIDGLVTFYHSAVLGPLAAVYGHGRIDVFEYPGYEAITSFILKKIQSIDVSKVECPDSANETFTGRPSYFKAVHANYVNLHPINPLPLSHDSIRRFN